MMYNRFSQIQKPLLLKELSFFGYGPPMLILIYHSRLSHCSRAIISPLETVIIPLRLRTILRLRSTRQQSPIFILVNIPRSPRGSNDNPQRHLDHLHRLSIRLITHLPVTLSCQNSRSLLSPQVIPELDQSNHDNSKPHHRQQDHDRREDARELELRERR